MPSSTFNPISHSLKELFRLLSPNLSQQGHRFPTHIMLSRMDPYTPFNFLQLTVPCNWQSFVFYAHCIVKDLEVQDTAYYVQHDTDNIHGTTSLTIFVVHFLLWSQPMSYLSRKRICECSLMYPWCQLLAWCLAVDLCPKRLLNGRRRNASRKGKLCWQVLLQTICQVEEVVF